MVHNLFGLGGIKVRGCAIEDRTHIFYTKFGAGDIVFNIDKARRGLLEKIVIKEVVPIKTIYTGGQFRVLYKDTFNALWNEWDLIVLTHAKFIALKYYNKLLNDIAELERANNC